MSQVKWHLAGRQNPDVWHFQDNNSRARHGKCTKPKINLESNIPIEFFMGVRYLQKKDQRQKFVIWCPTQNIVIICGKVRGGNQVSALLKDSLTALQEETTTPPRTTVVAFLLLDHKPAVPKWKYMQMLNVTPLTARMWIWVLMQSPGGCRFPFGTTSHCSHVVDLLLAYVNRSGSSTWGEWRATVTLPWQTLVKIEPVMSRSPVP